MKIPFFLQERGTFELEFNDEVTVSEAKEAISEQTNIKKERIDLIYFARILSDDFPLSKLNFSNAKSILIQIQQVTRHKFNPKLIPEDEREEIKERILSFPKQENISNESTIAFGVSESDALLSSYNAHLLYQIGVSEKELKEAEEKMDEKRKLKNKRGASSPAFALNRTHRKQLGSDFFTSFSDNGRSKKDEIMSESDYNAISLLQNINRDTKTCIDAYVNKDKNIPKAVEEIKANENDDSE